MVVEGGLHGGAVTDDIFASDGDLQAFFHQAELEVAAGGGAQGPVEEEELEWPLKGQRRCHHCGTTKTPRWRQGPEGRGTLCNACGVRYRSGRLLPEYRPLNSPTFSPDVHSNKHHRVVEMRLCPGSSATYVNAVGPFTLPTCQFPRSSRSRRGVLKKQKSHIHPDSSSRGSWYGNGGKVWFLQGLEVAAGGGGEGAAAEELDWLSNKDAMETVERKPSVVGPRTMGLCRRRRALASSPSPPRPSARAVPGQRCCRPCGTTKMVQWREAAAAAAGERKWLSRKDTFPAMEPEPSVVVPRTKGVRRRRRAQASSLSPSPPRPPTTAEPGQRRCRHCGTTETPKWREGPEGRCTLCNACGMAYRKGRLVPEYRPLSSPTFSPELHSNIYRRVN